MMREHRGAHLVVGVIPVAEFADHLDTRDARPLLALVTRLAKSLALSGDYAVCVNRERDGSHIFVAMADSTDAATLAGAVKAHAISEESGWSSRRSFVFDERAATAIEAAADLQAPRRRRSKGP